MHALGCEESIAVDLKDLRYVDLEGISNVKALSSSSGYRLCKKNGVFIIIDLPNSVWRELLQKFLAISFYPSHFYIDFEEMDFIEDANFIISSEA